MHYERKRPKPLRTWIAGLTEESQRSSEAMFEAAEHVVNAP